MKRWIIASAIVALIGCIGLAVVLLVNGLPKDILSEEKESFEENKKVNAENFNQIKIYMDAGNLHFYPSKEGDISIRYYGTGNKKGIVNNSHSLEVQEKNDQLLIYTKLSQTSLGFSHLTANLDITLPEKLYQRIQVENSGGNVKAESLHANSVDIQLSAGDISLRNISSQSLKLNATAGNTDIDNVTGDITVDSAAGNTTIHLGTIQQNLKIHSSSGDVAINLDKEPTSLKLDSEVQAGSSNVNLSMNYQVKSDDKINGKIGAGEHAVEVDVEAGNFDFVVTDK
ncbi:DUF4097 family beta strand repeat-containing protein [Aneurinibacillus aneurinilyticus]|uniref:DUF4097 domain-containing protein n=2 Tax=Aneurinibacillus aneurinilyticus TaxID=1391 RepID=U1Y476_ANEAE|nr:DUF4097 family beta strand repeat-containing protein [Aneurinibacillus aneurinilyticus]ERI05716.1 hypothetical protein HMPREF0083_05563 [Aneurinibacillus aneurinilyticus ATCC 12856]MED0708903.1 DUF4097 family beta strand repeat-containing protein [Aneurinibacillus aneurinilyticus]MED0722924.1 DUF4097 family beta strand repeat-containing protein [Aneurinibacillus aneurinilyticus]MED0732576.1 DUF4097 family beta strand repeat-containing protein [Aneurinibacillus aneurinilyticus]MED0740698.1 D